MTTNFDDLLNQLDARGIAFFHKGAEGRYRYMNQSGSVMLGHPVAAIIGSSDFEIFAASSAEMMRERDQQILASGRVCDYRSVAQTNNGWKLFHSIKIPLLSSLPGLDGLIGLSADITAETDSVVNHLLVQAAQLMLGAPQELFDVINIRRLNLPYVPNLNLLKLPVGNKVV